MCARKLRGVYIAVDQIARLVFWCASAIVSYGKKMYIATLAGCENQMARDKLADRERSMNFTLQQVEHREASREEKLNRLMVILQRRHEDDVRNTERNPGRIEERINEEFKRWDERQGAIQEKIQQRLDGKPENIEPTAIRMGI